MKLINKLFRWILIKKNNEINKYDNYQNETRGMYLLYSSSKMKSKREEH